MTRDNHLICHPRGRWVASTLAVAAMAAAATVAAGLSGCDPRIFDDLADSATVNASESPDGLQSRLYGVAIASGGTIAGDGASFLVLGRSEDGFGHLTFAADGGLSAVGVPRLQAGVDDEVNPFEQATPLVGDPASGLVAAGFTEGGPVDGSAPTASRVHLLQDRAAVASISIMGGQRITGLAFGSTDASLGAQDIGVARGDHVTIIANHPAGDAAAQFHCTHGREAAFSVAFANVDALSPNQEVIIVAGDADRNGTASTLIVLAGAIVALAGEGVPCVDDLALPPRLALASFDAPGGEPDFGDKLLVADFNGNGSPDLVATAPSSGTAYVYLDFTTATDPASAIAITGLAVSIEFGLPIAVGDLDGGGDELIVGDADASPDDVSGAGSAHIFELANDDFSIRHTIHDAQPESNQRFGRSVAVVPFGDSEEILVVGGDPEVFTYFKTPTTNDADVRQR